MGESVWPEDRYIDIRPYHFARVKGTRVGIEAVMFAFKDGRTAEEIQMSYPTLTLEQVYGAIAYCLRNRDLVEHYIKQLREEEDAAVEKEQQNPPEVVLRIRRFREQLNQ